MVHSKIQRAGNEAYPGTSQGKKKSGARHLLKKVVQSYLKTTSNRQRKKKGERTRQRNQGCTPTETPTVLNTTHVVHTRGELQEKPTAKNQPIPSTFGTLA